MASLARRISVTTSLSVSTGRSVVFATPATTVFSSPQFPWLIEVSTMSPAAPGATTGHSSSMNRRRADGMWAVAAVWWYSPNATTRGCAASSSATAAAAEGTSRTFACASARAAAGSSATAKAVKPAAPILRGGVTARIRRTIGDRPEEEC